MDAFIARQPILNSKLDVIGYELLFRSGFENLFPQSDPDEASMRVIAESMVLPGFEQLTCGRAAFINVTRNGLLREDILLQPPATTVIEVLETVEPDDLVLEACKKFRALGYKIALDDFHPESAHRRLLGVADIVKVDVLQTKTSRRLSLAKELRSRGLCLLAEKVETEADFKELKTAGYQLFQGYFFARPTVVKGRDIPAQKMSYLRILGEVHRPELDLPTLRSIVEREIGLSYKLLRYINSAYFGRRESVASILHALLLLGEREIRRWVSTIALVGLVAGKSTQLQEDALTRGRFCELLAPRVGLGPRASDLFLMGMLSLMEAMLDQPLGQLLEGLPLADDIKEAMAGETGALRDVLDVSIAYSRGEWEDLAGPVARLRLSEEDLPELYVEAVRWSQSTGAPAGARLAA